MLYVTMTLTVSAMQTTLTASADKLRGTSLVQSVSRLLLCFLWPARSSRFFRGLLMTADGCDGSASSSVPSVPSDGEYSHAVDKYKYK